MDWDADADAAVKKVPFFVRPKVKKRLEAHVAEQGRGRVTLADVNHLKQKFLSKGGMEKEIRGYEVTGCFSGGQCPHAAHPATELMADIESLMAGEDLLGFLKSRVPGDLKFHHEFKVVLADCPNACSRPQIADIGIIGARRPRIGEVCCSQCRACVRACPDLSISLEEDAGEGDLPVIDFESCLSCGKCIKVCPTGTLETDVDGFRVFLGGRLGRHPRLAMEVPGIHSHDQVLDLVKRCLAYYKEHSDRGQRFSHLITSVDQLV
ncbi:MAG: 4Fe-4S dicluster domain-containing protein [Desulfobacterales bacterium]|nr:4Fe-4S dicluster domain-containing protein [Desulfobacterales bacterium]